jgi:hypothetical protein
MVFVCHLVLKKAGMKFDKTPGFGDKISLHTQVKNKGGEGGTDLVVPN